jgi:sec-independent protein translocase protein TatC
VSEPDHSDPADEKPSPREKPMGFWEHIEELRGTLIKSAIAFAVCAGLVGYFLKEFNDVLLGPLHSVQANYPGLNIQLNTISVVEGFNVIIQMCLMGGLVLALPFMLYFIGQFVAPALTEKELRALLPLCVAVMLLFLGGAVFSFLFLVKSTVRMAVEINLMLGYGFNWTPGSYYSMLMWLVLGVGGAFEFPLVIVLLVWLGVMSTEFLRKYRRHAIVVIFIIAAIVTPTADPLTQTMFAVPLYVLYEAAIIAARRVEKRREWALRS